jgi:hypothetical protein
VLHVERVDPNFSSLRRWAGPSPRTLPTRERLPDRLPVLGRDPCLDLRVCTRKALGSVVESGEAYLGRYLQNVGTDHSWRAVFDVHPDTTGEKRTPDGRRNVVLGA